MIWSHKDERWSVMISDECISVFPGLAAKQNPTSSNNGNIRTAKGTPMARPSWSYICQWQIRGCGHCDQCSAWPDIEFSGPICLSNYGAGTQDHGWHWMTNDWNSVISICFNKQYQRTIPGLQWIYCDAAHFLADVQFYSCVAVLQANAQEVK